MKNIEDLLHKVACYWRCTIPRAFLNIIRI